MKTASLQKNERGFASLIVGITLVVLLGLLTVGFAQLMRNEQSQTTNRQLSDQAYYAAETGINAGEKAVAAGYIGDKTYCGPIKPSDPNYSNSNIAGYLADTAQDVGQNGPEGVTHTTQWTCLLIYTAPSSLDFGNVGTVTPTSFVASGQYQGEPDAIKDLTISWQDASNITTFVPTTGQGNTDFPPATAWSYPGILRTAITPLNTDVAGQLDAAAMDRNTFTVYQYPTVRDNNSSVEYTTDHAAQGQVADGGCDTANSLYCSVTIKNVPNNAGQPILFNFRSIYSPTHIFITATDAEGRKIDLVGAQTLVDSTGRDQDVLKRIQVRVPSATQPKYYYPGFVLDSLTGICKQIKGNAAVGGASPYASGCGIGVPFANQEPPDPN
ncbi:MAG TPA: hypothetical protein VHB51_00295 [Candidatus Saccharimonadales bacterium]|nr:hypothetical protein [Candidatus Saccharimonadales bacterium]